MTHAALRRWVDYAQAHEAVIVYDAAYEAYIRDAEIPRSIYEVEGAREVGHRVPELLEERRVHGPADGLHRRAARGASRSRAGDAVSLNQLWLRRQSTKSNGPPYVIQRAAAAVYTPEGQKQVRALIDHYMENARILREGLEGAGFTVYGGRNAPYIWIRTSSWDFFDRLRG
jgi:LL-diaminopimelate aminotransferase